MLLGEISLKEQLQVGILLVSFVEFLTELGVYLMKSHVPHQGNVGGMLLIEYEGMFHVSLIAVGLDTSLVEV